MDERTSVIFNLGGLDEQTQKLLGCLVTVGYEVAALSRADMLEEQRSPYHLVLDEFASFSAQSEEALARMLSLTRKYGLFCTLAHQTFSQLSSRLAGALQNTLQISFRVGRDDALWAAPRFGSFDPLQIKHVVEDDTVEPRTHPVFLSVQETYEGWANALESLKPREAFVRVKGKTVKIRTHTIKHNVGWREIEQLRGEYAAQLLTPRGTGGGEAVLVSPATSRTKEETSWQEKVVTRTVPLPLSPSLGAEKPKTGHLKHIKHVERPKIGVKSRNGQMHRDGEEKASRAVVGPLRRSVTAVLTGEQRIPTLITYDKRTA